jgi:hypothetical protein
MKPEERLHRQVARFLDLALNEPGYFWTTFPSGHFRGKAAGGILKACGLKAGVPDILIIADGRVFWIELKAEKGTLSPEQKAMRDKLIEAGCEWECCRSLEEVEATLRAWGFKLKARPA